MQCVSEEFVLTYLINKETIAYNLESLKISNQANIEISKIRRLCLKDKNYKQIIKGGIYDNY